MASRGDRRWRDRPRRRRSRCRGGAAAARLRMSASPGDGKVDPESFTEKAWEAISATTKLAGEYKQQASLSRVASRRRRCFPPQHTPARPLADTRGGARLPLPSRDQVVEPGRAGRRVARAHQGGRGHGQAHARGRPAAQRAAQGERHVEQGDGRGRDERAEGGRPAGTSVRRQASRRGRARADRARGERRALGDRPRCARPASTREQRAARRGDEPARLQDRHEPHARGHVRGARQVLARPHAPRAVPSSTP